MGPSVKFVSTNKGLISKKKNGGKFFSGKITIPGEGGGTAGQFGQKLETAHLHILVEYETIA